MKPFQIICPITFLPLETGIGGSYENLEKNWDEYITVLCPHCGEKHGFQVRDAFSAMAANRDAVTGSTTAAAK